MQQGAYDDRDHDDQRDGQRLATSQSANEPSHFWPVQS